MKINDVLPLIQRLTEEHGTGKELVMSHLGFHVHYASSGESILLMAKAEDYLVNNPTNKLPVKCFHVLKCCKDLVEGLQ